MTIARAFSESFATEKLKNAKNPNCFLKYFFVVCV